VARLGADADSGTVGVALAAATGAAFAAVGVADGPVWHIVVRSRFNDPRRSSAAPLALSTYILAAG
jgi:hypothetical protein